MSKKDRLGRNPLDKLRHIRPEVLLPELNPEKPKSLEIQVDWTELYETTIAAGVKKLSSLRWMLK